MNLKIDTKEKFFEITPVEAQLSAIMTADLDKLLSDLQTQPPFNVIFNMEAVQEMDIAIGQSLAIGQNRFYEDSHSFVICCLQPAVEEMLDKAELLEFLNVTPTLSEAWDIVQMEEIEREYLDGLE